MTTTEVATRQAPPLADRVEYSKTLSAADLLPPAFKGKPANILLAMDLAESLGRSPIEVMQQSQVISGKLGLSAEFMRSLVLASGHKLRVFMDGDTAVAQGIRSDDPGFTYEARWDEARARTAGLWGKGNWTNHPTAMLKARATTELCRDAFADVIHGVRSADELDEIAEREPEPRTPLAAAVQSAIAPEHEVVEAEVVEEATAGISAAQSKKMHALFSEKGFRDREDRLDYVRSIVGIDVASSKELTKDQASQVIEQLDALSDVEAEPAS
ncbi:recombinase RecT [Nakamurella aerolata]|uniref:RecT family protein n=1 Tax=Nakamurella aerolata TaxID=1656892 RepID=A0A849AEM0_9ACTN|nr:recombinase RecT [Nakamurella aerolata]NNG36910.1 hypothetical protein [Nakamurella aerolata]